MQDIIDRLETVTRSFPRALFTGVGALGDSLTPACGVGEVVHMDSAAERLPTSGLRLAGEEEALPFAPQSFDLIVSLLTLHGANDILGALIQARQILKPDGLFLAAIFGDGTLSQWRAALQGAEVAQTGALSVRVAPFAAIQDFGHVLSRAGFAMPVADSDMARVTYQDPRTLIADLRGMGETGALASPSPPLRRSIAADAFARFAAKGGEEQFHIVYLTGWAPHSAQPKPLKPGSARASMESAVRKFS